VSLSAAGGGEETAALVTVQEREERAALSIARVNEKRERHSALSEKERREKNCTQYCSCDDLLFMHNLAICNLHVSGGQFECCVQVAATIAADSSSASLTSKASPRAESPPAPRASRSCTTESPPSHTRLQYRARTGQSVGGEEEGHGDSRAASTTERGQSNVDSEGRAQAVRWQREGGASAERGQWGRGYGEGRTRVERWQGRARVERAQSGGRFKAAAIPMLLCSGNVLSQDLS
jgi:hypothetical protein